MFTQSSNSMIVSNNWRQGHNILALACGSKLKGNPWTPQEPHDLNPKTQMQTLTRTYKVLNKDYYDMTIINEHVYGMKLAHLLSSFSKPHSPLLDTYLYSNFLIAFLNVHIGE